MQKVLFSILSLSMLMIFLGCGGGGGSSSNTNTGSLQLSLTDAPIIDEDNVTGVFISITQIQYHGQAGWKNLGDFNTSLNPINLLDLQNGLSLELIDEIVEAGKYTQIRFILDAVEEKQVAHGNPGCFIQFDGDRNETIYVPSGSQSGYKTVGNFTVPVNGSVSLTADFDVRKSITHSSSVYKLKPTIRLIATELSGSIEGTISGLTADNSYVIYAYDADDNVNVVEAMADDFSGAITSATVNDDGSYTLAFLEEGAYDLIVVEYDNTHIYQTHNLQIGLSVNSDSTTQHDFAF